MMGLIGRIWKHRKVWRLPVLIDQTFNTQCVNYRVFARVRYSVSGMTPPTQSCGGDGCCLVFVGGVSGGVTPGPIPNPEAKSTSADGTALGRVWESRSPPA